MSVIQYGVEVLKVKHIIICGHYGCGGIQAVFKNSLDGPIGSWIQHIKKVYDSHREKLENLTDEEERLKLLCELNVMVQVTNACNTPAVLNAWESGQELVIHGWVYSIEEGHLKNLNISVDGKT
jgi:carbonic anhydrase